MGGYEAWGGDLEAYNFGDAGRADRNWVLYSEVVGRSSFGSGGYLGWAVIGLYCRATWVRLCGSKETWT
jgi:hypothetical protein